jgi:hypothetical protein
MATHYARHEDCDRTVEPAPARHCVVCGVAAPMEMALVPWLDGKRLEPNTTGWMRSDFPYRVPRSGLVLDESQWLCPRDAEEVAKFIAHRRVPMLSDEDLIG